MQLVFLRGTTRQGHNSACRRRFEEEAANGPKVRKAIDKQTEFYAVVLEEEDKKRKRPRMASEGEAKLQPSVPVTYGDSSGSGLTEADRVPTKPSTNTSWS